MKKHILKRILSSILAGIFVVSSIATNRSSNYEAADANATTTLYYPINSDTQQKVATTEGELPTLEIMNSGAVGGTGYDNNKYSGGSYAKSWDYTVKNAYRTTNGKIVYPGEQIICIDHWTRHPLTGETAEGIALLQSYGLSFMIGNFAAKWEDYENKIPHEPRIDLLTVNTDFTAFSDPDDYQGSSGDTGTFLPDPGDDNDPSITQDYNTNLVFTSVSKPDNNLLRTEVEYVIVDTGDGPVRAPISYHIFPYDTGTASDINANKELGVATGGADSYAFFEAEPPDSLKYIVLPTYTVGGDLYGIPPSYIESIGIQDANIAIIDCTNDSTYGLKSFPYAEMPDAIGAFFKYTSDLASEGYSYFVMDATGMKNQSNYPSLCANSRIITYRDRTSDTELFVPFGQDRWVWEWDLLYTASPDMGSSAVTASGHSIDDEAASPFRLFTSIINTFEAALSSGDFKNISNITIDKGNYTGRYFATGYKGTETEPYYTYYNAFYSLLSQATYNYYSHNNLFSHVLADGTKVPRYFSGSGIGAKTAVANQGLQGSTAIQPFWNWESFKNAHGQNYGFVGDFDYPVGSGNVMPNGRTAEANADRMILLAEYINNKMTRSITSDAMKDLSSLSTTVNNRDTFEAAITWNTGITKKFSDPQDLEKMYHFSIPDPDSNFGSSYSNASFIVTDESGNSTMTAPSDYMLVGPFYAHTDYPESRMQIGFTQNIDVSGLAEAGDEIITSTLSTGEVVADYVILTSEAIINNRGEANTDRRVTDLYDANVTNKEYDNPMNEDSKLMQSYEVVNGNVPLTNADLGNYDTNSPREVVKHEPTYWDGTTTPKDIYDSNYNTAAKDGKFIINNWGKGEFYIAVRRSTDTVFTNQLPQVTIGYESQTGTLTQTNVDLTNTNHSTDYQGFLISDIEKAKSSAIIDLNLNLANIKINKADDNGTPLSQKAFYLYRLADKNPQLPETDPNRYEWVRYVPVYANIPQGVGNADDLYYPSFTDKFGNINFDGLIPGWYMLFEHVNYSFRKVSYLQTYDETEPERQGTPIKIEDAGYTGPDGEMYNTSVTLPVGARGQDIPIDDPLQINQERAGDVFYVDNGKVKGISMEGTNTIDYNVYSNIVNDPVLFFKEIGDVNKLIGIDGEPLNITRYEYEQNIQFILQAEEQQDVFYVCRVEGGQVMTLEAELHEGPFPAEDEWIEFGTGEPVDMYWWINSTKVRIEEHINPALGIHPDQVEQITGYINTGLYDWDLMKYANEIDAPDEYFENNISDLQFPVALKIVKEDSESSEKLEGAAFTLYNKQYNVYATSDNTPYEGNLNAYLTDAEGNLNFIINEKDPNKLELMLRSPWTLTEVKAPDGYSGLEEPLTLYFKGMVNTVGQSSIEEIEINGEPTTVIAYTKTIPNEPPKEEPPGNLTVTKDWYQYIDGRKEQWLDGGSATFNLYRGELGNTTIKLDTFTLSSDNPTYKKEDLPLADYWIEEVNVPEGVGVSYSTQKVTLTPINPNATISVENVKHNDYNYTIALAKKSSKQASMTGTSSDAFSNLPYYDGPAQFVITYNGPQGEFETTITYDRTDVGPDGYLKIKVPYAGDYSIREINIPEGYEPEIKVAGTGVEWSPIDENVPFGFNVPDNPGDTVALHLQIVNNKPASLSVIKTDMDTGERIWDEEMELTMYTDANGKPSNQQLGIPQKMGDDGRFLFKTTDGYNFEVGDTVWLVETNPPKDSNGNPYKPIQISVYISEDIAYNNAVVTMENELEKSQFKVTKVGPNDEPIEGAIFEVYSDAECIHFLGTGTTDSSGVINFELKGKGPFYVKEIYVPEPYVIDSEVHIININDDEIPNLKVTNNKEFRIVVRKTNEVTGKPVANAEFQLLDKNKQPYRIDGQEVTGKTDALGNIIWNITGSQYLTVDTDDTFYLRETVAPDGYFKPTEDFKIEIKETNITEEGLYIGCYVFDITNKPKYGIRIKKTEVLDERPATPNETEGLEGITFKIYKSGTDELVATEQTDSNGVIELKELEYGKYYAIEEVDSNSIYEPNPNKIPLTLKALDSDGNFYDDSWSTYNWIQNIRKTGSASIYKVDNEGNYLAEISFGLYKYNGSGTPDDFKEGECELIKVDKTSSEGKLVFDKLELGKYWLVEISELPTYLPAEPIYFEITPDNTEHDMGDVVGQHLNIQVVNTRIPASIKVIKKDNETDKPIQGIKFSLTDGVTTVTGVTNSEGILTFENLKRGVKYTLVEVETVDDYILNDKPIEITLGQLDTVIEVNLVNSKMKGSIKIIKVSKENSTVIPGAEFQLFADGLPVGDSKLTDSNGIITWEDLVIGPNYEVQEISVPEPYILSAERIPVVFEEGEDNTLIFEKTVINDIEKYYVRLWKIDGETNGSLTGAEFDLYMSDKTTKINSSPIIVGSDGMTEPVEVPAKGTYYFKETKAPEGYVLDDRFIEVTAYSSVGSPQIVIAENNKIEDKSYFIELVKIDGDTSAALAGAEFTLYDSNRQPIETKATGSSGSVRFEVKEEGTYYVKETKAPTGYELIDTEFTFTVNEKQAVYKQEVENFLDRSYAIKVYKKDRDNNAPLANAVFEVFDSNYIKIGEMTTILPNGDAIFEVPNEGTYYLKEKQAPEGYDLIDGYIEVSVGGTVNVVEKTIYNEKNKEYFINVYKKDKENNAPLANATFEVFDANYNKIDEITTTLPNGSATIKVPNEGTYYLKEKQAPAGYELIEGYIPVEVGGTANVVEKTIYNERTKDFWITIYKKDSVNNAPLADATFGVYASDKTTLIGTITTTLPNGSASIKVPNAGTYYLKEIKAPDGYKLIEGFIPVEVGSTTNVVEKTIYNEQDKFFITVYKKDSVNNTPLGGAEFEVYDESNNLIGKFVTQLPTGAGTFEVPNAGTYFLKEVKAPDGYTLKPGLIPVVVGGTVNVVEKTIYNDKTPQYIIRVYKQDAENKAPLSQAVIGVYDSNYNKIGEITTTIPDGSGYIVVDNPGTYYLKEFVAPRGYKLYEGYIPVTVNSNTNIVESCIYDEKEEEPKNSVEILKVDEDNLTLSGVKFGIYDGDNKRIDTGYTDKNGELIFDLLDDGTYYVKEEQTLPGYIISDEVYTVKLSGGASKTIKVVNTKEEGEGWISIKKYVEGTTTPLSGVIFSITSDNGYNRTYPTDPNGNIYIRVPEGNYTIQEVQGIEGYIMDTEPKSVTVKAGDLAQDLVFYNAPSNATLAITKIDADTKAPLSGAKFGVYNNETLIATLTTDSNGRASTILPYGTYMLRELQAPTGYILDIESSAEITIDNTKQVFEITITNKKIPVVTTPPKTGFGGGSGISTIILSCVTLLSGVLLIMLNKREIFSFIQKYRRVQ